MDQYGNPTEDDLDALLQPQSLQSMYAQARAQALRGGQMPQQPYPSMMQPQASPMAEPMPPPQPPAMPTRPLAQALLAQQRQPQPQQPSPTQPQLPQAPQQQPPGMDSTFAQRDADLQRQYEAAMRASTEAQQPPDASKMAEHARRRSDAGQRHLLQALAATQAGDQFKPVAAHLMQQAADASGDMKMTGGTLTAEGWVEDPGYAHAAKVRSAEARVTAIERAMANNLTEQSRRELARERADAAKDLQQARLDMQQAIAGQGDATQRAIAAQADATRRFLAEMQHGGKEPPKAVQAAQQAADDGRAVLSLLGEAEKHLKNSTGSYLGKGVDEVGRFFGHSTPGATAASALGTIGGQLVSKMPKMSGPQSDRDVDLYKQMAGRLDDPTQPYEAKKAALDQIRVLNQKYAPGAARPDSSGGWDAPPAGRGREVNFNDLP